MINDGVNTAQRIYKSHFKDQERQDGIDMVHGLIRADTSESAMSLKDDSQLVLDAHKVFHIH